MHIRLAKPEDVTAIIEIVNAAFGIETFLDGTRTDEQRMSDLMRKGVFLVGEEPNGQIVASAYAEPRGETGYLGMLAVDPSRQGKGFGRLMMEGGEAYLRNNGCKWADITVLSLRPELPPIYRKWGYAETRTEEFHPSRPLKEGVQCVAIVMSKKL